MSPASSPTAVAPAPTPAVTALNDQAADAAITTACRTLFMPTIRDQAAPMAEAAARERLTHKAYLAEVLAAECDDRDARRRIRRIKEAKFPRTKHLADFDTTAIQDLPAPRLAHLATGAWIEAGEPLVLLGESGTGKTHLLIGLGRAAAEQGRRVRYVSTAALVNELTEAADAKQLSRVVARYARLDLLCLDELGYVSLDSTPLLWRRCGEWSKASLEARQWLVVRREASVSPHPQHQPAKFKPTPLSFLRWGSANSLGPFA